MSSLSSVLSTNPLWFKIRAALQWWLVPRSLDRDDAFRERVIRSTTGILFILIAISFLMGIFVFRNPWGIVSFPSLHIIALLGCTFSAIAVSRGNLILAGWLLVLTILIASSGLLIIASQSGDVIAIIASGIPSFMFAPVVTALVLPRTLIFPIGILAAGSYLLSQFGLSSPPVPDLTLDKIGGVSLIMLLIESALLRQLRFEFDARLQVLQLSIEQTEQARQEAEIARKRAEDADNAKSQFLASMSHELRTPLNAIIGYSEAMIGGMVGAFTEKQAMLLGHIQHNGRRLLSLINDILDLSKIESGSLEVFLAPMALSKTFRQTIDSLSSLADNKQIYLKVEFADNVPEAVLSDSKKIEQILVNLLSNAIKFTDEGGVAVRVSSVDKESWRFSVVDTGIGMPEGAAAYIFEPFRQVDGSATRKHKGTGLGLAITKRLVDHLGGKIEVESELKKGTIFTVTFPITYVPTPSSVPENFTNPPLIAASRKHQESNEV